MRFLRPWRLALATVGIVCFGVGAAPAAAGGNGNGRHKLEGSKPAWTAAAPQTSTVPAGEGVMARVWLARRSAAGLDALAKAVSAPSSAQYGRFLSEARYRTQFAPTAAQV